MKPIQTIRAKALASAAMLLTLTAAGCPQNRSGDRPKVAVALGDSFVSGEGAEDFITGDGAADFMGAAPNPLFVRATNSDPYSCHRSANASIFVANLPGIDERIMIACSGADPEDLIRDNPTFVTTGQNGLSTAQVLPQLDDMWAQTADKDVELVLVGIGANNSVNNFSGLLSFCHAAFMADAAGGPAGGIAENQVTETFNTGAGAMVFPSIQDTMDRNGCVALDFYTQTQLNTIRDAYEAGLRRLLAGMRLRGYQAGEWKLVVQGYASPFAPDPHEEFEREDGGRDTQGRFAALARERYAAGCPFHLGTLEQADDMAMMLSNVARDVVDRLRAAFPDDDIVFLDVQRAFDGGRLCERADSPAGALWNPVWFRTPPGNALAREIPAPFGGTLIGQWRNLVLPCADATTGVFARCQDSAHPNEDGQAVLGRCLSDAVARSDQSGGGGNIACRRNPNTGAISVQSL